MISIFGLFSERMQLTNLSGKKVKPHIPGMTEVHFPAHNMLNSVLSVKHTVTAQKKYYPLE